MTWLLTRTIVLITLKIVLLMLFRPTATQSIGQHQLLLEQLGRIVGQVRKAQMMHPSLLVSQYGSVLGYLKDQLPADDWYHVQFLSSSNQGALQWLSLPNR